jgi:hypothetical protein
MLATCRFCKKPAAADDCVKYGVRHYAHYDCYLDRKPLHELWAWQVRKFPYLLLAKRGLLAEAESCTKGD